MTVDKKRMMGTALIAIAVFAGWGFLRGEREERAVAIPESLELLKPSDSPLLSVDGVGEHREVVATVDEIRERELSGSREVRDENEAATTNEEAATKAPILPGLELWFLVADETHAPLIESTVEITWGEDGGLSRGSPWEKEGYVWVGGVPEGLVQIEVRSPGYLTRRYETLVPWNPPRTEAIALADATTLSGRVRREGNKPLGPVTVYGWQNRGELVYTAHLTPEDAGAFVFGDVPVGPVHVAVVSEENRESASVVATTRRGEDTQVELVLGAGRVVAGTVLELESSEPIASAEVSLLVSSEDTPVATVASVPVDGEGDFALAGCSEAATVVVKADGYVEAVRAVPGGEAMTDLGAIYLSKGQSLTICLVGDEPIAASRHLISSLDGRIQGLTPDADGCLTVEGIAPGPMWLQVELPTGGDIALNTVLVNGEEWRFEIPVNGFGRANITFGSAELPVPDAIVSLTYGPRRGVEYTRQFVVASAEPVEVDGLIGDEVSAKLWTGNQSLGRDTAGLGESNVVDLRLEARPELRVRVVDVSGKPISGAAVFAVRKVRDVHGSSAFTDENGFCSLWIEPGEGLACMVNHETKGHRVDVPIPPSFEEVFEIVLDPSSSLRLSFDSPIGLPSAVNCMFGAPYVHRIIDESGYTDTDGTISWKNIHQGRYFVQARHPDLFPLDVEIDVSGKTEQSFYLDGRGNVSFHVTDAEGLPVPGATIDLYSPAHGVDVPWWEERTWIELPPNGMATDVSGGLFLEKLATGTYEWNVLGSAGTCAISHQQTTMVSVQL